MSFFFVLLCFALLYVDASILTVFELSTCIHYVCVGVFVGAKFAHMQQTPAKHSLFRFSECIIWFRLSTDGVVHPSRKRSPQVVNPDPKSNPGDNTTRTVIHDDAYLHVVLLDHVTRRKA